MFKRNVCLVVSVFVLCLGMFGCGKKEAERTDGKVQIWFSTGGGDLVYNKILKELCLKFEATHPNIKIKFEPVSGQGYMQKILTMIASDTAPDVFSLDATQVPIFVNKNAILPFNSFIEKDKSFDINKYYPVIIDGFTWNNKLYGLTESMTPYIVYYNKDIFDKAGVAYPKNNWDWNDLLSTAKKLTIKDSRGAISQFGIVFDGEDIPYFVKAWGGSIWNKDKTKCTIDSPESREGLQFMVDIITKHKVAPDLKDRADQGNYQIFEGGRAAMITLAGRWYTPTFRKAKNLKWRICGLPKGKVRVNQLVSHAWVIPAKSRHPEQAFEFIKYLCGEEGVKFMMQMGDCVPPIIKLAEGEFLAKDSQYPDENNAPYIEEMKYAGSWKEYVHPKIIWSEMGQVIYSKNIDGVLLGKWDVPTYTKNVQKKLNELLEENK
ncbi:MAG: hypothetical protein A2252_02340 [Elusimicrobia bacterium RIFOXYA2_FULL_39_19]|nr:MAG: hypothetical protein A2252_02340 [Elusimicrobia bacterium RIFOXYA2_FULL_39_19]